MGHRRLFLLFLIVFLATTHAAGHCQAAAIAQQQGSMGVGSMMRTMVGSRPPICAGRCWWCGGRRCEAVQVPVTPQELSKGRRHGSISSASPGRRGASHSSVHPSSYYDHSNYKPLSWRCKCGEVIFNP
ncbi:hypothetical protein EJB05_00066, partial [Eragrostis curvula]